jgi:hypothetical protein
LSTAVPVIALLLPLLPSVARAQFTPPSGSTLDFMVGTPSTQTIMGLPCAGGEMWLHSPLPPGLSLADAATSTPDITGTPLGPVGDTVVSLTQSCAVPAFSLPAGYTIRVAQAIGPPGATAASVSLEKCQRMSQLQTAKYLAGLHKAMGGCLQKIAQVVVKEGQASIDVSLATGTCLGRFYTLGRIDGRSLADKMAAKIQKTCDPGNPSFSGAHGLDDVAGIGFPTVNQTLRSVDVDGYCGSFGAGSSTLFEWIGCLQAAAECSARQQIAVQFPRALEWLGAMDVQFMASSDAKKVEALAALQAARTAIDGAPADDRPDLACGP